MSCLSAYEPLNTLKPIAPDVWIVDGPVIEMSYGVLRLPFTTRMTLIKLSDGGLWAHSPTPLTPDLRAQIDALGEMRALIAPNKIHYWWLPEWSAAYPDARTYAAPRVRERARDRFDKFDVELGPAAQPEWLGEIEHVLAPGAFMTEAEFFHVPSRTLVLTDMIENFERERVSCAWLRLAMRAAGVLDPNGSMPRDLRLTFRRRKSELRDVVQLMLDWSPARVLLAHGRCYDENADSELKRAFAWVL